jgi:hypothetical protein
MVIHSSYWKRLFEKIQAIIVALAGGDPPINENYQNVYLSFWRKLFEKLDAIIVAIVSGGGGGGIPDAPKDGKDYLRKNGQWADAGLDSKLDKVKSTAQFDRAYVVTSDGEQTMYEIDQGAASPDTISWRGSYGEVKVGTPIQDEDAANKGYVDSAVATASHDTYKEEDGLPDIADAKDHVMYLIKTSDDPLVYEKYVINDGHTAYIDMGKTTDIDLTAYRTASEQDAIDAQEITNRNNAIKSHN